MQISDLLEVAVRDLEPQQSEKDLPERLEAEQLATGDGGWKSRHVADLSSNNLFNHLCDLNLRAET